MERNMKNEIRVWAWNDWLRLSEVGDEDITDSRLVTLPDSINPEDVDAVCTYLKTIDMKIEAYRDGISISFPFMSLPEREFNALTTCIRRNREAGKIEVIDAKWDKKDIFTVHIGGLEGGVPEFMQLLEAETLMTLPVDQTNIGNSLKEKILKEFHKLVDNQPED
jgi:hypothetical protein